MLNMLASTKLGFGGVVLESRTGEETNSDLNTFGFGFGALKFPYIGVPYIVFDLRWLYSERMFVMLTVKFGLSNLFGFN